MMLLLKLQYWKSCKRWWICFYKLTEICLSKEANCQVEITMYSPMQSQVQNKLLEVSWNSKPKGAKLFLKEKNGLWYLRDKNTDSPVASCFL